VPERLQVPVFFKLFLLALVLVGFAAGVALWLNRGAQVRLDGRIVKVRTIATDDNASIAVLEIRFSNPADTPFVVRDVRISAIDANGVEVEGMPVIQSDLDRVLDYYKAVGPRYNPVLRAKERFRKGEGGDRTVAGSFNLPEAALKARRNLKVFIEDVDGYVVEIAERGR
jgi:hypothetical protein